MWVLDWLVCMRKAFSVSLNCLTICRKWLTLEGAVLPGSARPKMSGHQKTEDK